MCYVTATELKNNLSYYLEKSKEEDVFVTKNNQVISVLVNPHLRALDNLEAIIKNTEAKEDLRDKDIKELIGEEILKKCGY